MPQPRAMGSLTEGRLRWMALDDVPILSFLDPIFTLHIEHRLFVSGKFDEFSVLDLVDGGSWYLLQFCYAAPFSLSDSLTTLCLLFCSVPSDSHHAITIHT